MIIIHLSRRVASLSSAAFFPHRQSSKSRSVAGVAVVVVRLRGPRSIRDAHLAFALLLLLLLLLHGSGGGGDDEGGGDLDA